MSRIDICTCAIKRDKYTTVVRGLTNPMTYAEVEMSRFLFGDGNVSDVVVIGYRDKDNQDVLTDLRVTYGGKAVANAFPGTRPRLPVEAPNDHKRVAKSAMIDFDERDRVKEDDYQDRRAYNMNHGDNIAAAKRAGVAAE